MIAHQAIASDAESVAGRVLSEELEVHGTVRIVEKDGLLPVAALGDVVPTTRHDHTRDSRHPGNWWG